MFSNSLVQVRCKEVARLFFLISVSVSVSAWADSSPFVDIQRFITGDNLRDALNSNLQAKLFDSGSSTELKLIPGKNNNDISFKLEFIGQVNVRADPEVSIVHEHNNGEYPTGVNITTDYAIRVYYESEKESLVKPKSKTLSDRRFLSKDKFLKLHTDNYLIVTLPKQKQSLGLYGFLAHLLGFSTPPAQVFEVYVMTGAIGVVGAAGRDDGDEDDFWENYKEILKKAGHVITKIHFDMFGMDIQAERKGEGMSLSIKAPNGKEVVPTEEQLGVIRKTASKRLGLEAPEK